MRIAKLAGITALALGATFGVVSGARAGEYPIQMPTFEGMSRTSPQCPMVTWVIHPVGNPESGGLSGVVWFADMSGVSLARGMMDKSGKFSLSLAAVSGSGPTGTVTGTRAASGALMADLDGPGCSKLHVQMMPTMHEVPQGSG